MVIHLLEKQLEAHMNKLFLALDFPTWEASNNFITTNQLEGVPVKVGMELFYREGIHVIEKLKENNHPIFLDLKLHDIPTTVMRAMRNLASLEVDIVNVHALGGSEMIQKAKEGLQSSSSRHETKLLAVTILTSMDEKAMQEDMGLRNSIDDNVIRLAKLTEKSGADGVVCSVHEANKIYQHCSENFLTVTPGIRLSETADNDQKRIATPAVARAQGASSIVVGRSITAASNPLVAYKQAIKEWEDGITN